MFNVVENLNQSHSTQCITRINGRINGYGENYKEIRTKETISTQTISGGKTSIKVIGTNIRTLQTTVNLLYYILLQMQGFTGFKLITHHGAQRRESLT